MGRVGEVSLIFSYIRRLDPSFLGVQNLNFNMFWGLCKIRLYLRVIIVYSGSFLKVKEQNGNIFLES